MKFFKRLLVFVAVLLVGAILAAAGAYYLASREPDFYRPHAWAGSQLQDAGNRASQKLAGTMDWIAAAQASEVRSRQTPATSTSAATTFTVSFTQAEINAFFQQWEQARNWRQKYDKYLQDPMLALHQGQVIFAARMRGLDQVASMRLMTVRGDHGAVAWEMSGLKLGKLPMPDAVWSKPREQLLQSLRTALPALQRSARIDPDGGANAQAVQAAMTQAAIGLLEGQATDAVLFLPTSLEHGRPVPVKLASAEVAGDELKLEVQPLNPAERGNLLERIRRVPHASAATDDRAESR